jgi:hypothetical protein
MASPSRTAEREEERRHTMRTLAAASTGSAAAALLTSQLWIAGTWIAAALTPVIVALVSELMNRPAERIARTLTSDRAALREADREALPEAGGAAPPARPEADPLPTRAVPEPAPAAPVRVYRAGEAEPRGPRTRRRKIAYGAVFGTAALAFVIAVAALTVPELVAGGSVGKNDTRTTFFGGGKGNGSGDRDKQAPQDTSQDEQAQPEEEQQQTTPQEEEPQPTTPTEEPPPEETAPEETAPPGEPLPQQVPPTEQP